jgi:hypothetical protein
MVKGHFSHRQADHFDSRNGSAELIALTGQLLWHRGDRPNPMPDGG